MFVRKNKFRELESEICKVEIRIELLELAVKLQSSLISDILDNNQSIIDTNKLVLDKLEEYLKAKVSND